MVSSNPFVSCALARKPEVIFLDEPISALDYPINLFIRDKLQDMHMKTGVTWEIVSHDLEHAAFVSDSGAARAAFATHDRTS